MNLQDAQKGMKVVTPYGEGIIDTFGTDATGAYIRVIIGQDKFSIALWPHKVAPIVKAQTIYVVAWEYDGGGGFDWFRRRAHQRDAWAKQKVNRNVFKELKWRARKFQFKTMRGTFDAINQEIEARILAMEEKA